MFQIVDGILTVNLRIVGLFFAYNYVKLLLFCAVITFSIAYANRKYK